MTINGKAYIAGAYEHPRRKAVDKSLAQLHAEVAKGALDDAGLMQLEDLGFCAKGKSGIHSFSVMRAAPVPYAIAYVTLAGTDISMMTNIINCDFEALHIGQAAKACFVETEGDGPRVPMFEPA